MRKINQHFPRDKHLCVSDVLLKHYPDVTSRHQQNTKTDLREGGIRSTDLTCNRMYHILAEIILHRYVFID
jgi:hypothetical protein